MLVSGLLQSYCITIAFVRHVCIGGMGAGTTQATMSAHGHRKDQQEFRWRRGFLGWEKAGRIRGRVALQAGWLGRGEK